MKEVSCKAAFLMLEPFFKRRGHPVDALLNGIDYPLDHLKNKHERIDWSSYCTLIANARKYMTEDDFIAAGEEFITLSIVRLVGVVGRLLFTSRDLYRFMVQEISHTGNQMFTCVEGTWYESARKKMVLNLALTPGYEMCHEFFLITKGTLSQAPRFIALPPAKVDLVCDERGGRFDITYPGGGGTLAWLRRAVTWPFTARSAAREAAETHDALMARYADLDEARTKLDRQATQLRTAHSIAQLVHGELDIERTLGAVAKALEEVGEFASVEIELDTVVDEERVSERTRAGEPPTCVAPIIASIELHGHTLGQLMLWPRAGADMTERRELLAYVVPVVHMAIDNAITFTSLVDYRDNLELKVELRTAELHDALQRLSEAHALSQRIFANLNHEIRTPLSLITLASAALAKRRGGNEGVVRYLRDIDTNVHALLHLLDGMLLLAAGQEGKLRFTPSRQDVAMRVQSVVSAWEEAAGEHDLSLTLKIHGSSHHADVDGAALDRVVGNLISNAVKFTPRGGSIEVDVSGDAEQVQINVCDTGIGIDEELKERIFGRFEQGKPAVHPGSRGSGLGLAIVKELSEAHGGGVEVETRPEGGTTFVVTFPRQRDYVIRDETGETLERTGLYVPAPEPKDTAIEQSPPDDVAIDATVLVAEDDGNLRNALVEILARQYHVLAARNGEEALQVARERHPDLLVTDLSMPKMDGLELARKFRQLEGNRLAPVIFLSAYGQLSDRLAGLETGAVDYLVKPFDPDELLARVRSQLDIRRMALRLHESEKLASLAVLSSGLAHELRNPANVVLNAVEPLRATLPDELREDSATIQLLEIIETGAHQIAELCKELLGMARPGEFHIGEVRVATLVERARTTVSGALDDIRVEQDVSGCDSITCALPLVVQIVAALLENGAHAAGSGGTIWVSSHEDAAAKVIEVYDSGPGVPPDEREKIFDPFFTTKPPGKGTGLGLTMARMFAQRHGGTLRVVERDGQSRFRLELPHHSAQSEVQIMSHVRGNG